MNFQHRLERAIERGSQAADARLRAESEKSLSKEELRNLHSKCRLELSEHIESCLKLLSDRFPGFEFHSIMNEGGWGARISRDDLRLQRGSGSSSLYSRLEMTISPLGATPIVELIAKATIRNKEIFSRTHFQRLDQIDPDSFREMIDVWVLEFAERFAASR
ncbi:MAG: hypothetical protein KF861_23385 [Planctomycetaceae bacterium]|nr:hypothetical protein [Planctomycetaceae bacterium]